MNARRAICALTFSTLVAWQASDARARARPPLSGGDERRIASIFAEWDGPTSPGCAVGVARAGTTLYRRGFGQANLEKQVAITPSTVFHVASLSKQFTALGILLVVNERTLSLDDDIRTYVPELPAYRYVVTIRDLLRHTSGIPDQWELLRAAGWREGDVVTEQDVMNVVVREPTLQFEPGTQYRYSNTGYTLAAIIVRRVSGRTLRDFAASRIFRPAAMVDTQFRQDHRAVVPRAALAYKPDGARRWTRSVPAFDTYGATNLLTTVDDLLRWEANFASARVGGRAILAAMQTPGELKDGSRLNYGLGLEIGDYRSRSFIGHGGRDAGFRADVIRFPESDTSIAVLCNASTAPPRRLSQEVAGVVLGSER